MATATARTPRDYLALVEGVVDGRNQPDPEDFAELLAAHGKTCEEFEADCQLLEQRRGWFADILAAESHEAEAVEHEKRLNEIQREIHLLREELQEVSSKRHNAWARTYKGNRAKNRLQSNPPAWLAEAKKANRAAYVELNEQIENLQRKAQAAAERLEPGDAKQCEKEIASCRKQQETLDRDLNRLCELALSEAWPLPAEE